MKAVTMAERFWSRVEMIPFHPCWEWTGNIERQGYGTMRLAPKILKAHRVSWMLHFGPIPLGVCVCHHCDNPTCVRPDHLFLGTIADNNRDMVAKGRQSRGCFGLPLENTRKTKCHKGHVFDRTFPTRNGRGRRDCSICLHARNVRKEEFKRQRMAADRAAGKEGA